MEICYRLNLPTDECTVPVVRRLAGSAMAELGVSLTCVEDVVLALSEACANAIEHSSSSDHEYDVIITIDDCRFLCDVVDRGSGFDSDARSEADPSAERGRGIQLMRAVVDLVSFESGADIGTVVHLEKVLEFDSDSALFQILGGPNPSMAPSS